MHSITLFEDEGFVNLLPVVYWRSVFELRVGRKIMLDQTAQRLGLPVSGVWTRSWIAPIAAHRCGAPANQPVQRGTVLVNGRWLVGAPVDFPAPPCAGVVDETIVYIVPDAALARHLTPEDLLDASKRQSRLRDVPRVDAPGAVLTYPWELVRDLAERMTADWREADAVIECDVADSVIGAHASRIHLGERTLVHPTAVLDASRSPIFISHDVRVGAYVVIEGPAYVGPGSIIHPHTRLHGGVAIGPVCRIGGEIDGCIIDGYTNKQHAGFLGHAYVGSWVNIGAGATNSDLKNTYGNVRVPVRGVPVDTQMNLFGAIIGDHAKIGINAAIPTGACIGFASMIHATRYVPKYVPSFGWVTDERVTGADAARLLDVASTVMARRDVDMTDEEVELFLELPRIAQQYERGP